MEAKAPPGATYLTVSAWPPTATLSETFPHHQRQRYPWLKAPQQASIHNQWKTPPPIHTFSTAFPQPVDNLWIPRKPDIRVVNPDSRHSSPESRVPNPQTRLSGQEVSLNSKSSSLWGLRDPRAARRRAPIKNKNLVPAAPNPVSRRWQIVNPTTLPSSKTAQSTASTSKTPSLNSRRRRSNNPNNPSIADTSTTPAT